LLGRTALRKELKAQLELAAKGSRASGPVEENVLFTDILARLPPVRSGFAR